MMICKKQTAFHCLFTDTQGIEITHLFNLLHYSVDINVTEQKR